MADNRAAAPEKSPRASPLPGLLTFLRWFVPAFALLGLLLALRHRPGEEDLQLAIRSGILRDLLAEMPIGRQALVGSFRFMPLPTLAALPFVPFLPPEAYGYACDYGLALALAGALLPLASLLGRLRLPAPRLGALALLTLSVLLGGNSGRGDALFCLALAVVALHFDLRREPVLRALAGVFYGLALFSHFGGILLAAGRILLMIRRRLLGPQDAGRNAVDWINASAICYALAVYLFFNWMVMLDPLYAFRHARVSSGGSAPEAELARLPEKLGRDFPDHVPVVSGHWGYCLKDFLRARGGYHFMDFHHDKLPAWERRRLLLIVPTGGNPLGALCDLAPGADGGDGRLRGCLLLAKNENWLFYLTWPEHGEIVEN